MEKKYDPEKEGDFSRDDSNTGKRPRKVVSEGSEASSPFMKDKRPRISRVTDRLNERTPRPSADRAPEERSPYKRESREPQERRPYEERRPYTREPEERRSYERRDDRPYEDRRRSYNPNFDGENRVRRPAPHGNRYESTEEDKRYNSYHNDRNDRPQRDDRDRPQQRDYRSREGGYAPRNDRNFDRPDRPDGPPRYAPRNDRNDYPPRTDRNFDRNDRSDGPSRYAPRNDRNDYPPRNDRNFDRTDRPRYTRDDRPAPDRYGNRNDRNDRNDRGERPRYDRNPKPYNNNDRRGGDKRKSDPFKTPKGGYDSEFKPKVYPAYAAVNIVEPIRLNKFISMSGLCSRREADEFIREGNVTVNGQVVVEMGVKINPTDTVHCNGEPLQGEKRVYILMNKPKGFVTTVEDPNADRTVMDIVKNACRERVYPVGRLDKNSLGVLLITNDGELTKRLTHPSHEKKKVYQVTLDRAATAEELEKLYDGVTLDDGVAKADEVAFLDEKRREIGITIHTGRNRIVRRMFEELGYHVQKLDRVYFAGLTKKGLRRGAWRYLTPKEVAMIKSGKYE